MESVQPIVFKALPGDEWEAMSSALTTPRDDMFSEAVLTVPIPFDARHHPSMYLSHCCCRFNAGQIMYWITATILLIRPISVSLFIEATSDADTISSAVEPAACILEARRY